MTGRTSKKLTTGRSRLGALIGLGAIVLLLSGCLRYEGTIQIDDDGSGSVDVLTAVDPSAFEAFGDLAELGGETSICDDFASETQTGFPADANVQPYNEDGFCGARVTFPLAASTDHSASLADVLDPSTRLYKQGENWFFESNFDVDDVTGEADDFGLGQSLFEDASFVVTVDLPGRAIAGENNATNVGDDGRFTWDIDLSNPPAQLFAQTEPGSGGGTGGGGGGLTNILIGVVVLALIGAGAYWFLKIRNADGDIGSVDLMGAPGAVGTTGMNPGAAGAAGMPVPAAPVADGPPINPAAPPVTPRDDSVKETTVMNMADAQRMAQEAAAGSTPEPKYDEALGAWIVDDPNRGRLRHDAETDTWNPIT